jgi:hypothetical protein
VLHIHACYDKYNTLHIRIQIRTNVRLNEPFILPSLEEMEQMERQRLQAIESLEIFDHHVKCQKCGIAVPIVGKLNRPCNDRLSFCKGG